jgi:aspartate kinase
VDDEVGLLAIVGEGMRGTPGLAGRIVRRDGLEKAVRAVHQECGMGN